MTTPRKNFSLRRSLAPPSCSPNRHRQTLCLRELLPSLLRYSFKIRCNLSSSEFGIWRTKLQYCSFNVWWCRFADDIIIFFLGNVWFLPIFRYLFSLYGPDCLFIFFHSLIHIEFSCGYLCWIGCSGSEEVVWAVNRFFLWYEFFWSGVSITELLKLMRFPEN